VFCQGPERRDREVGTEVKIKYSTGVIKKHIKGRCKKHEKRLQWGKNGQME